MGPNNFENQIYSMQQQGFNTSGSQSSAGNAMSAFGAVLGLAELAYNIHSNERNYSAQKNLNALSQSNFENQYQIMSRDLSKAGFNPSALLGGAQNSTPPSFSAPQVQHLDMSGISALMDSLTNAKLADSQIALNKSQALKNTADAEHTSGDFDFRTAERIAAQEFAATEAEKTRQHEHKENERRHLLEKHMMEWKAWWQDNRDIKERNFQREMFKGNKKYDLLMKKADYQAELNIRKIAHDYQVSEDSIRGFIYQTANKMLEDQKFKQRLIEAQYNSDLQKDLITHKFKEMYQFEEDTMWITQLNSANDALFGALAQGLASYGAAAFIGGL